MPSNNLHVHEKKFQHYLQKLKVDILRDVEGKIDQAMDQLYNDLDSNNTVKSLETSKEIYINKNNDSMKRDKVIDLPKKEFHRRDSLLTEMFNITHFQSVYNICAATLFLLILKTIFFYAFDTDKSLMEDIGIIVWATGNLHLVLLIWLCMNSSIFFIVYPCLKYWSSTRHPNKCIGWYDISFGTLFIIYQLFLFVLPGVIVIMYRIPPISAAIVVFEQVRLTMKVHAFIRENVPRALAYKVHQDDNTISEDNNQKPYPEFRNLIYFLFAPTFVYRDNYPRTPNVQWRNVIWYFVQFAACVFCTFVPFCRFIVTTFSQIGHIQFTNVDIILIHTKAVLIGGLIMFLVFYGMLHCWCNMFAEMLQFGDRQFYQDWWNSTSFSQFYRTWNTVVHDWLYTYVYRDTYYATGKNKLVSLSTVFFISAIVHEYIIVISLGYFFPVLFVLFGTFGVWVMYLTRKMKSTKWNVFIWAGLFFGWGLMTFLYSSEWYARINCPIISESWLDHLVPRFWNCMFHGTKN